MITANRTRRVDTYELEEYDGELAPSGRSTDEVRDEEVVSV